MDWAALARPEKICESPRSQGRAQIHELLLEAPVLETLSAFSQYQCRVLKGEYMNLCTSLGPRTFELQALFGQQ